MNYTISACAGLIDLAQRSVDHFGWDHLIGRYLGRFGCGTNILILYPSALQFSLNFRFHFGEALCPNALMI